jgi:hypothetical protein
MKTRNLGLAAALVACLAAMGGIGCKKEPAIPAVVSVAVTPATCSVAVGATTVLHAQAYDANNVALGDAVTWSSSDTSKATVDASGIVTGVSMGNATITASVGSIHSNAVAVTVIAAAPHIAAIAITLDHSSIAVAANANATAIATAIATDQFLEYRVFAQFGDHAIDSKAVWPGFSRWLWNDVDEHVLDFWEIEDDYDFGLADLFADTGPPSRAEPGIFFNRLLIGARWDGASLPLDRDRLLTGDVIHHARVPFASLTMRREHTSRKSARSLAEPEAPLLVSSGATSSLS